MSFKPLLAALSMAIVAFASPPLIASRGASPLTIIGYYAIHAAGDAPSLAADPKPNGLYSGYNATHDAYHGEIVPVRPVRRGAESTGPQPLDIPNDPSCNGQQGNLNDIGTAQDGLASWLGNGLSYSYRIYYLFNSVYAFGCDYGHGQSASGSDYRQSTAFVDSACGRNEGGWNSIHSSKSTYGRQIGREPC